MAASSCAHVCLCTQSEGKHRPSKPVRASSMTPAVCALRSSAHIIGLGIRGHCPHGSKCWLYFPEPDCPFYRATVFSHYAPGNCPPADARLPTLCLGDGRAAPAGGAAEPGPYWSLMFEVSESALKPVPQELAPLGGGLWPAVVAETLAGAVATRMLAPDDQVVSIYHRRAPM